MDELRGLTLGADDYITKPFKHPTVVVERVKAVLRRCRNRGASRIIRFENLAVDLNASTACVHHPTGVQELSLTMSELKLLARMAEFPGRAIERAELIDTCFTESAPLETSHQYSQAQFETDAGARVHLNAASAARATQQCLPLRTRRYRRRSNVHGRESGWDALFGHRSWYAIGCAG
ncbi:hypothetical protein Q1M63_03980 (plasmid) [Sinorhizobium meliloti]|nr:hypothetical protein LZK74_03555 [Sinorhizobium meliloti]WKL24571.1 hypothetical protein Q1M63_03980 [Sinorhizobium meliloti]WKL28485.1 hypothetical protein Q1M65_02525 [Sinorhizobium meliloti]